MDICAWAWVICSFLRTLETGIRLLEKNMPTAKGGVLSGEVAFTLYDTYGFPLDLTELILRENGMTIDVISTISAADWSINL